MNKLFGDMICFAALSGGLLILSSPTAYSGTLESESVVVLGKIYVGLFGGGAVTSGNLSQEGTAFYSEARGGPLAVNAVGKSDGSSGWIVGGHIGYEWPEHLLSNINSKWTLIPAMELEGYYLGGVALQGDDINNETARLTEHDFHVTYPMKTGVYLINGILNVNHSESGKFHPYVGVGVGSAVVSILGANATQKNPAEPGINHYNSDPNDTAVAFAAQPKIGIHLDLNSKASLFVEYRFLYLSDTDYIFGSTVDSTHVATTNWTVKIDSQYYHVGTIGIQYDL